MRILEEPEEEEEEEEVKEDKTQAVYDKSRMRECHIPIYLVHSCCVPRSALHDCLILRLSLLPPHSYLFLEMSSEKIHINTPAQQ